MTFDYNATKRDLLSQAQHIGRAVTSSVAERGMSPTQIRRRRAKNIMTDDVWQYRVLANGALVVEIAYSWFLDKPLFGLTVFCVGDLKGDAEAWDHSLSGALGSVGEVVARLAELNQGGRERIAALAAQA